MQAAYNYTDFKTWYNSLPEDTRNQIQMLHKKDLNWNWVLLLFVGIWAAAAFAILSTSAILVHLLGYLAIGVCIHGMANLMHEGIHNNLFRTRKSNWLFGLVAGLPALFSITAYKVNHLIHHQHTGTDKDPDEMNNLTQHRGLRGFFFYLWLVVGIFVYLIHVPANALRFGTKKERLAIVFEYLLMFAILGSLVALSVHHGTFYALLQCWAIPVLFAGALGNIRGWAEHMLTDKDNLLLNTRTVTSHPVYSFLNINLNYHLEHHLFPKVPWYNLPKLHVLLLPKYAESNVKVYASYLVFLRDAFRAGPFGRI